MSGSAACIREAAPMYSEQAQKAMEECSQTMRLHSIPSEKQLSNALQREKLATTGLAVSF